MTHSLSPSLSRSPANSLVLSLSLSLVPQEEEIAGVLASQQGHLRYQVQQIVNLRHAPQLVFLPDRQDDARTRVTGTWQTHSIDAHRLLPRVVSLLTDIDSSILPLFLSPRSLPLSLALPIRRRRKSRVCSLPSRDTFAIKCSKSSTSGTPPNLCSFRTGRTTRAHRWRHCWTMCNKRRREMEGKRRKRSFREGGAAPDRALDGNNGVRIKWLPCP